MKNDYNTNELLQFMIPGLEMGIRTLQDQIAAIKSIVAGNVKELPIKATGKCTLCPKSFKNEMGLRVHVRRMHPATGAHERRMRLVTKKRA